MVQSHILALAAIAQKTELSGLVEQAYPIGSESQTFLMWVVSNPSAELYFHVVHSLVL